MKKQFIFILFISLSFPIVGRSQTIYFNNRYESVTNIWNSGKSIIELEDTYIIGGSTGHPSNEGWFQISLFKIDHEGNMIFENIIGDLEAERDLASHSLLLTEDNEIYFSGNKRVHTSDWVHDQCMLVRLNSNLEVLWTKYYGEMIEPYDTSFLARHSTICYDNGFVIVGNKMPYGLQSKIFIIKTDETGENEWENQIGTGTYYYQGFSVVQTTDGGYAIGGYRFHIGQNETADPIIYKTDSMGNLEWEKNLGGPYFDYHPMLTLGNDGNIVAGTCYADSMSTPSSGYRRVNIVKLDNQGNVIWNNKYGQSITYHYFQQIRTLEDGSYIATGSIKNNFPHISGWLFKISEGGDSLWYRQYDNLLGSQSQNYLYDVIPTSDNGFAACGYVIPMSPDPGSQDAWVLKVDSMGCDTPGCATGVQVFELSGIVGDNIKIWPNPTIDKFWVQCSEFWVGGTKMIRVYNSQGLKVEEIEVPDGLESMEIDVSKYTDGLYYLQYIHANQIMETVKFIKN